MYFSNFYIVSSLCLIRALCRWILLSLVSKILLGRLFAHGTSPDLFTNSGGVGCRNLLHSIMVTSQRQTCSEPGKAQPAHERLSPVLAWLLPKTLIYFAFDILRSKLCRTFKNQIKPRVAKLATCWRMLNKTRQRCLCVPCRCIINAVSVACGMHMYSMLPVWL